MSQRAPRKPTSDAARSQQWRGLALIAAATAFFAIGWWVGQKSETSARPRGSATELGGERPTKPAKKRAAKAAKRPRQPKIRLRLDAGAVRLVPDASLHFGPIAPLGLDAGPIPVAADAATEATGRK